MGWWLLIIGVIFIIAGLYGKITEYKNLREYVDFQNMTTNKRYLKVQDQGETQKENGFELNIKKRRKTPDTQHPVDNSGLAEDNMQDIKDKKNKLNRINRDLDQIINEITRKESKIRNYFEQIEHTGKSKKSTTGSTATDKNEITDNIGLRSEPESQKSGENNKNQIDKGPKQNNREGQQKEQARDALLNNKEKIEEVKADFQRVLDQTSTTFEEETSANKQKMPGKHAKVLTLYRQGKDLEEIAEELNIGIRETQLILRLHQGEADKNV